MIGLLILAFFMVQMFGIEGRRLQNAVIVNTALNNTKSEFQN